MSGILAQGARFHLLGMPRNYALTFFQLLINRNANAGKQGHSGSIDYLQCEKGFDRC